MCNYVAIGANLPDRPGGAARSVQRAVRAIAGLGPLSVSRLWISPAYPAGSGPNYVNAVASIGVRMAPGDMLAALHRIEAHLGRDRSKGRWTARLVDLDLLACGDAVRPSADGQAAWRNLPAERQMTEVPDGLVLPHPRIQDRAFVLAPWAEIAPGWRHPLTGRTVAEMLADLPEGVRRACRPL